MLLFGWIILVWLNYSCLVVLLLFGWIILVWLNYSCMVFFCLVELFSFGWYLLSWFECLFVWFLWFSCNAWLFDYFGLVVMLVCLITLVWLNILVGFKYTLIVLFFSWYTILFGNVRSCLTYLFGIVRSCLTYLLGIVRICLTYLFGIVRSCSLLFGLYFSV